MEKVEVVPSAPPRGPAGLDGVLIDSCAFTETVAKREPRPPLFQNRRTGNVFLVLEGPTLVYVAISPGHGYTPNQPEILGQPFRYWKADDIPYTGPITPAMWAIIRKWWNP